ncbi:MAG TPA: hypothetical protein VKG23_01165 [Thermoanaerobaculia bacterium]|nr:hypothetical protein [Thermoanaerobaculia bacterium]
MTPPARPAAAADAFRAADRLRHDLGKAIRLSAPDTLETDTEALRARLRADVRETRRGPAGCRSAAELFARWRSESGALFPENGALGARVAAIARIVGEIGALAETLDTLDRPELERLDRLTRDVARECRALADETRLKGPSA